MNVAAKSRVLFITLGSLCILGALLIGAVAFITHPPKTGALGEGFKIDRIVVNKSTRTLSVFRDGSEIKTYWVALGREPVGPKEQEGDMRTPEGLYTIDYRN